MLCALAATLPGLVAWSLAWESACASEATLQRALRLDTARLIDRRDPATPADIVADRPNPGATPASLPIRLPARIHRDDGNASAVLWLEIDLPGREAMPPAPAIYLPRMNDGGAFYLNGAPVFSLPWSDALTRVRWRRARWFVLPDEHVAAHANRLTMKIVNRDFLVDVPYLLLGERDEMERAAEDRQWLDQYGSQFTGFTAAIVGAFMLAIWWARRREPHYLLFGLSSLLWAVRTLNYSVETMPTELWWWWRGFHFLTVALATMTLAAFFHLFAGLSFRRWVWPMGLHAALGPVLVVASDVTAEVQHEEQRERHREEMEKAARLAALGELIGGVAHELNNPLTAILGFAELMEKASPGEDFEEEVEIIRKEALRARDIVRDLLFIARPGQVERGEVQIEAVVGHVERLRRPAWSQLGIEVSIDTAGMGSPIYGNEHQLTQVLLNLVTNAENAVKDNPRPRIAVRARTRGESAIIEVEDNGHGMDAATRDRIFEPFFTTRQGDGTGLGLSLSYSMVAAHDGQIEVQSTPGAGTIFRVVLPLRAEAPSPPEPASPAPAPAHARALVVDDEPSLRVLSQRLIGSMGHECAVAPDSATATALAQEQGFDLVICDYRLATETAGAVIAGFQQVAPGLVERTVIATGATTDPGVVELVERHNLRLIAKPYGIDEIAALLAEAAARR
ncbi:response regulator [bacterium]|nr:MAG: response regulator [bacterium]